MSYWNLEKDRIDIVYLWVDSNDEVWLEKKNKFLQTQYNINPEANNQCRFTNNDELKYSLRSLEKYVPWIGNIYIVTDEQIPNWLNVNHPKINMVFHKDLLPEEVRPCFSSETIEYYINEIEGLSEYFLYSNDDQYFNQGVTPEDFFTKDEDPICRFSKPLANKDIHKDLYSKTLYNSQQVIKNKFGIIYKRHSHHNIDTYKKSIISECKKVLQEELKENATAHFRNDKMLQRAIYSYYACATEQGQFKKVSKIDYSLPLIKRIWYTLIRKYQKDSIYLSPKHRNYQKKIKKYNPKFFCINDNPETTDEDRIAMKEFLESYFPKKSSFEL